MASDEAELRLDMHGDGLAYTRAEFEMHYGGTEEWAGSPVAVFDPERGVWRMKAATVDAAASSATDAADATDDAAAAAAADSTDATDARLEDQEEQQDSVPDADPSSTTGTAVSPPPDDKEAKRLAAIKAAEDFLAAKNMASGESDAPSLGQAASKQEVAPLALQKRATPLSALGGNETAEQMEARRAEAVQKVEAFHAARAAAAAAEAKARREAAAAAREAKGAAKAINQDASYLAAVKAAEDFHAANTAAAASPLASPEAAAGATQQQEQGQDQKQQRRPSAADAAAHAAIAAEAADLRAMEAMAALTAADAAAAEAANLAKAASFEDFADMSDDSDGDSSIEEDSPDRVLIDEAAYELMRKQKQEEEERKAEKDAFEAPFRDTRRERDALQNALEKAQEGHGPSAFLPGRPQKSSPPPAVEVEVAAPAKALSDEEQRRQVEKLEREMFGLVRESAPSPASNSGGPEVNDDDDDDRVAASGNNLSPSRKGVGRAAAQRADAEKLAAQEAKDNAAMSAARERAHKANLQQSKAQRVQAIVAEKEIQIDISRKRRQRNAIADSVKHDDPAQAESLREGIKEAARTEGDAAAKRKEAAAGILDGILLEEEVAEEILKVEIERRRDRLMRNNKEQKNPPTKESIELYLDELIVRHLKKGFFVGVGEKATSDGARSVKPPSMLSSIYHASAKARGILLDDATPSSAQTTQRVATPTSPVTSPPVASPSSSAGIAALQSPSAPEKLEARLKSAEQQTTLMRQAVLKLQGDLAQRDKKIVALEEQLEQSGSTSGESAQTENKSGSSASSLAADQPILSQLRRQLADARQAEDLLTAELDAARQTATTNNADIEEVKAKFKAKEEELEAQRREFDALQSQFTMVEGRSAQLEKSLTEQAEVQAEKDRSSAKVSSSTQALESTLSTLRDQLAEEKAARSQAEAKAAGSLSSSQALESMASTLREQLVEEKAARSRAEAQAQSSLSPSRALSTLREQLSEEKAARSRAEAAAEGSFSTSQALESTIGTLREQLVEEKATRSRAEAQASREKAARSEAEDSSSSSQALESTVGTLRTQLAEEKAARSHAEDELDRADEAMDALKRSQEEVVRTKVEEVERVHAAKLQAIEKKYKESLEAHAFSDHLFAPSTSPVPGGFSPGSSEETPARRESNLIQNLQAKLAANTKKFEEQLALLDDDQQHLTKTIAAKVMCSTLRSIVCTRVRRRLAHWRRAALVARLLKKVGLRLEDAQMREAQILNELSEVRSRFVDAELADRARYQFGEEYSPSQFDGKARNEVLKQMMQQQQRAPRASAFERGVLTEKPSRAMPGRRRGADRRADRSPPKKKGGGMLPQIKSPSKGPQDIYDDEGAAQRRMRARARGRHPGFGGGGGGGGGGGRGDGGRGNDDGSRGDGL